MAPFGELDDPTRDQSRLLVANQLTKGVEQPTCIVLAQPEHEEFRMAEPIETDGVGEGRAVVVTSITPGNRAASSPDVFDRPSKSTDDRGDTGVFLVEPGLDSSIHLFLSLSALVLTV